MKSFGQGHNNNERALTFDSKGHDNDDDEEEELPSTAAY